MEGWSGNKGARAPSPVRGALGGSSTRGPLSDAVEGSLNLNGMRPTSPNLGALASKMDGRTPPGRGPLAAVMEGGLGSNGMRTDSPGMTTLSEYAAAVEGRLGANRVRSTSPSIGALTSTADGRLSPVRGPLTAAIEGLSSSSVRSASPGQSASSLVRDGVSHSRGPLAAIEGSFSGPGARQASSGLSAKMLGDDGTGAVDGSRHGAPGSSALSSVLEDGADVHAPVRSTEDSRPGYGSRGVRSGFSSAIDEDSVSVDGDLQPAALQSIAPPDLEQMKPGLDGSLSKASHFGTHAPFDENSGDVDFSHDASLALAPAGPSVDASMAHDLSPVVATGGSRIVMPPPIPVSEEKGSHGLDARGVALELTEERIRRIVAENAELCQEVRSSRRDLAEAQAVEEELQSRWEASASVTARQKMVAQNLNKNAQMSARTELQRMTETAQLICELEEVHKRLQSVHRQLQFAVDLQAQALATCEHRVVARGRRIQKLEFALYRVVAQAQCDPRLEGLVTGLVMKSGPLVHGVLSREAQRQALELMGSEGIDSNCQT